ncbi:MAG: hypothetical protein E7601_01900 [Ruminococcaceae bacterium]|nr:hypothetical protein [Oscillospiraceae bacterium]
MKNTAGKRPMRDRFISFMAGRNGPDALGNFCIYLGLALTILNFFIHSLILSLLSTASIYYSFFRMMSRSIYKRQAENARFLKIQKKASSPFVLMKAKFRDRKTHVYRKCPYCKNVLRLPKRIGEHTAVCPCCRTRFDVTIK